MHLEGKCFAKGWIRQLIQSTARRWHLTTRQRTPGLVGIQEERSAFRVSMKNAAAEAFSTSCL